MEDNQKKKFNPIRAILNDEAQLKRLVKQAFEQQDTDKNGKLDFYEMMNMMEKLLKNNGQGAPEEVEIRALMKQLDTNQDGYISLDEFQVLMVQTLTIKAQQFD